MPVDFDLCQDDMEKWVRVSHELLFFDANVGGCGGGGMFALCLTSPQIAIMGPNMLVSNMILRPVGEGVV